MSGTSSAAPQPPARSFAIRPPRRDEAGRVWELILELAEYERLTHRVSGSAEAIAQALFGDPPAIECLVVEESGVLVGYAVFYPTFSTFQAGPMMWLEDLYVDPRRRGHGIGRALLAEVARRAVERGCGRLDWYVLDWNEPAIGFYERIGATRIAQEWHHYGLSGRALAAAAATSEAT